MCFALFIAAGSLFSIREPWEAHFPLRSGVDAPHSGLEIVSLEGGHQHEPFTEDSTKIFIVARRRESP